MNSKISNKILVMGLTCLSAVAMGQSDSNKEKAKSSDKPVVTQSGDPHEVVAPRDTASGQASGKRMHKPITVTAEVGSQAPTASKEVSKKEASDDWQATSEKTGKPALQNTSATSAASSSASSSSSANSNVKSPRDAASGQASGRTAQPIGSQGQDGVSTAREASSGMATGKKSAAPQKSDSNSKVGQSDAAPKK